MVNTGEAAQSDRPEEDDENDLHLKHFTAPLVSPSIPVAPATLPSQSVSRPWTLGEGAALSKMTIGHWRELRYVTSRGDGEDVLTFKMLQDVLVSPTIGIGSQHLAPLSDMLDNQVEMSSERGYESILRTKSLPSALLRLFPNFLESADSFGVTPEMDTAAALYADNCLYVFNPSSTKKHDYIERRNKSELPCRGRIGEHKPVALGEPPRNESVFEDPLFKEMESLGSRGRR